MSSNRHGSLCCGRLNCGLPIILTFLLTGLTQAEGAETQAEWSSFQNGGQISVAGASLPSSWSPEENLAWSTPITGYGQSSPVVWGNQVYVTSVSGDEKDACHITAFNLKTGEQVWQESVKNAFPQKSSNYISRAAPTPAADKNGIICFFEGGNLLALSHTGSIRWQRDLVKEYGPVEARHGLSASVEQNADAAFVWVERSNEPYLICVRKSTGENLWKTAGIGVTSWSSPRLIPVKKGEHLVLSGSGKIEGRDPATGEKLWTFEEISGNSSPTPVPVETGQFLIGASEGRGEAGGRNAPDSNGLIQIQQNEKGTWSAKFAWQAKRATSSFGSPVAYGSHAYFVNRTGVLFALDLKTGEEIFAGRIGESIWSTPIATNDRLFFFGKSGKTTVVATGTKLQNLSTNETWKAGDAAKGQFSGPVLYAAIASGNRLILRRGDHLYCFQKPE